MPAAGYYRNCEGNSITYNLGYDSADRFNDYEYTTNEPLQYGFEDTSNIKTNANGDYRTWFGARGYGGIKVIGVNGFGRFAKLSLFESAFYTFERYLGGQPPLINVMDDMVGSARVSPPAIDGIMQWTNFTNLKAALYTYMHGNQWSAFATPHEIASGQWEPTEDERLWGYPETNKMAYYLRSTAQFQNMMNPFVGLNGFFCDSSLVGSYYQGYLWVMDQLGLPEVDEEDVEDMMCYYQPHSLDGYYMEIYSLYGYLPEQQDNQLYNRKNGRISTWFQPYYDNLGSFTDLGAGDDGCVVSQHVYY